LSQFNAFYAALFVVKLCVRELTNQFNFTLFKLSTRLVAWSARIIIIFICASSLY